MIESQPPGVQCLASETDRPQRTGPVNVALFTDERVAAQPCLDPNLVAPSGAQANLDQRRVMERLRDAVFGNRFGAARVARVRLFLDQRLRIPHQHVTPGPRRRRGMPIDDGEVYPLRFAPRELRFEALLRMRVLREHDQARSVLIDAVDDVGAPLPQWTKTILELFIDGRRLRLPLERDRQDAGRLVDDDQCLVFENDLEAIDRPGAGAAFRAAGAVDPETDD